MAARNGPESRGGDDAVAARPHRSRPTPPILRRTSQRFRRRRRRHSRAARGGARRRRAGRALVVARDPANCVLCHEYPIAAIRFAGDVGPSLGGVGARLSLAQLRLRVADNLRAESFDDHAKLLQGRRTRRVAAAYRGKPILSATRDRERRRVPRHATMTTRLERAFRVRGRSCCALPSRSRSCRG